MENSAVYSSSDLSRMTGSATADRSTLMRMKNLRDDDGLVAASKEFVGVFLNQMYSAMAETSPPPEMFNGGRGEEIFRGMLYQEYARDAAYQDSTGLGKMVYQALKAKNNAATLAFVESAESAESANQNIDSGAEIPAANEGTTNS